MNEIVKRAVEAGFEFYPDDGNLYAGEIACTTVLKRFARAVEQATLERAAEKLAAQHTWITNIAASQLVLALKDSHD